MSDEEEQIASDDDNQADDQSLENDGMDELFGDDGDSEAGDQQVEYNSLSPRTSLSQTRLRRDTPANKLYRNGKPAVRPRQLNDSELDSGDDDNRNDRMSIDGNGKDEEEDVAKQELKVRETAIGRHAVPRGSDGEV